VLSLQSSAGPPTQSWLAHASLVVHLVLSTHGAVLAVCTQPNKTSQLSSVQMLLSLQSTTLPPVQIPSAQASLVVHLLPSSQAKPSILVLPFVNMSGAAEQEYFVDGLTEDILTELSRFRDLFVISRNTVSDGESWAVRLRRFVLGRLNRDSELGLRLTIDVVFFAAGVWAFSGVLEDVLEKETLVRWDIAIAARFHDYATTGGLRAFAVVTQFGAPVFLAELDFDRLLQVVEHAGVADDQLRVGGDVNVGEEQQPVGIAARGCRNGVRGRREGKPGGGRE